LIEGCPIFCSSCCSSSPFLFVQFILFEVQEFDFLIYPKVFLYIEKNKLNELYAKHLECATSWPAYWTNILEAIDNSLQAEMENYYNNLNKKLDNLQSTNHKHHKLESRNQQQPFYQHTVNLTNINFTTEEQKLLDQGMQYCMPQPTRHNGQPSSSKRNRQ